MATLSSIPKVKLYKKEVLKKMYEVSTETLETPQVPAPIRPFFTGKMPIPPSTNFAYQVIRTKSGSRVGPAPVLDNFKSSAALMLSQGYHDWSLINAIRDSKKKVPLAVKIEAYFSSEWKRDLDGIVKFAIDAAFTRIALNDNLVVQMEVVKLVDQMEPRIDIEISVVVR